MHYKRNTTGVVERHYIYDVLGRPTTRQTLHNGKTQNDSFAYNSKPELTSATLGTENFAYAFDEIGNQTQFACNATNETTIEGDFVPAYDADGNATLIKTATGTWSVSYNGENRPVRFECAGTQTVVEMNYDYLGRRFEKKITVAGTTTLHHRYVYRGFLQIACLDLTRAGTPALWFVFWDPTQPTGTRPLAIQKNGTWFVYGHDLTKNVCEVFGSDGYIKTTYSYSPFGNVSSVGNFEQNFQWSSEFYDPELALVYYNYRHYSPTTARWLSRDPIEEQGGLNLYCFVGNKTILVFDNLGLGYLDCLSDCFKDNDPTEILLEKALIYLSGMPIPKKTVAILYDAFGMKYEARKIRQTLQMGASKFTTIPSALSAAIRAGGASSLRLLGRFFAPIAMAQLAVDAAVAGYCAAFCCGKSKYDKGTGNLYHKIEEQIDAALWN